jgi:hypothetical protein
MEVRPTPQPWKPLPLRAEEFHFSLLYAGANAGSERWMTQFDKGQFLIRREATFQGGLGMSRRIQISRFETNLRLPTLFSENDSGRIFETAFDRRAGTVTLRQNRDEATQALTQDYHDPLSIVQLLRDLDPEIQTLRVPMVGGTVLVTRLEDEPIQTPWGEIMARAYYLRPGMGFIYIELEAPYRPLKFVQAIGRFVLESSLTRTSDTRIAKPDNKRPKARIKQAPPQKTNPIKTAPTPQKLETENPERKTKRKRRFRKRNKGQE